MKVFISWSGDASNSFAVELGKFLRSVIQQIETFMSSEDIRSGSRWFGEIGMQLQSTKYGILCLTQENLNAPWILFEAGALAKEMGESNVVPVCVGFKKTELVAPLSQFQSIDADREGLKKLVVDINKTLDRPVQDEILHESIDRFWDKAQTAIDNAIGILACHGHNAKPKRTEVDMLEELLTTTRGISHQLNTLTTTTSAIVMGSPLGPMGLGMFDGAGTTSTNALADAARRYAAASALGSLTIPSPTISPHGTSPSPSPAPSPAASTHDEEGGEE